MKIEEILSILRKKEENVGYVGDEFKDERVSIKKVGSDVSDVYDVKDLKTHTRWLIEKSERISGNCNWVVVELTWGKDLDVPVQGVEDFSGLFNSALEF